VKLNWLEDRLAGGLGPRTRGPKGPLTVDMVRPEPAHPQPAASSLEGEGKTARTLYDCPRISRRIGSTLFATESVAQAAFIASGTVSALASVALAGDVARGGVPAAVLRLTAALAAPVVAVLTERLGRRWGLALGLAVGALGAVLAARAVLVGAFALFLGGVALMGSAFAAMLLIRFALAEVHPQARRGRAISIIVVAGAIGSLASPGIVALSGGWARWAGVDELAGPYVATAIMLAIASWAILAWLRPDPLDVGRKMAAKHPETTLRPGPVRPLLRILTTPAIFVAVLAMVLSQGVIVWLMTMTSVQMQALRHGLGDISLVLAANTMGMFAPSLVSGHLADRWGRGKVIVMGAVLLVVACASAPLSTGTLPLATALFLLGAGWNLCYVAGSALLTDQLSAAERAGTQGANELLMGLAGAATSFGAGLAFAATSYAAVGLAGAAASLLLLILTGGWLATRQSALLRHSSTLRGSGGWTFGRRRAQ
jgi:MFS family permease